MANRCKCCADPNRDLIDALILQGISYRRISSQFGMSDQAVRRHAKMHMPELLAKAHEAAEVTAGDRLLDELNGLREEAARTARKAEEAGDGTLHLRSVDTRARMVRIKADVQGVIHQKVELDDQGVRKELEDTREELERWITFVKRVAPGLVDKYIALHGEKNADSD